MHGGIGLKDGNVIYVDPTRAVSNKGITSYMYEAQLRNRGYSLNGWSK